MVEETEAEINKALGVINTKLGNKLKLGVIDPKKLTLLEKNARYMDQFQYQGLLRNIKNDGFLSSVPLCHKDDSGRLVVISGNHRTQASIDAGVKQIIYMYRDDLTRSQQVAEQLAHNSLSGQDDMQILKSLWDEIDDLDSKVRSGLDSELIAELAKIDFSAINSARLIFETVQLLFLPEELQRFDDLLEDARMNTASKNNYLCSMKAYETVFEMLVKIKKDYEIKNTAVAFMQLVEWAEMGRELEQQRQTENEITN